MTGEELYSPESGDEFIRVEEITSNTVGRYVEYRNPKTGEGLRGPLADAIAYLINDQAFIRYQGENVGEFMPIGTILLLKAEGWKPDTPTEIAESDSVE